MEKYLRNINLICPVCNIKFVSPRRRYNQAISQGRKKVCSKRCACVLGSQGRRCYTPESTKKERMRANGFINIRVKCGKIKRPGKCQLCGRNRNTESHHADYKKPNEVSWLCRSCHMKKHWSRAAS